MDSSILIRELAENEAAAAKSLILSVIRDVYPWKGTFEELAQELEKQNIFYDMADIANYYSARGGLFLGAFDNGRLIGTAAVWPLDGKLCELKRMWLTPEYWGRGIGYAMIQRLFTHAREQGWWAMYLCTDRGQKRAINFYHRVGFDTTAEGQAECGDGLSMRLSLETL